MDIKELDKKYIANTYARFPVQIVKGKGSLVYDENGKQYIDLGTGIAVNTFGFSDDIWKEAISKQMDCFQHTSNLYYAAPCVELARILCERTGMKKVFYSNSGAEANECAIKAARRYSELKYGAGRYTIITMKSGFHGRTLTTLAATGQEAFHKDFLPLTEGFVYAEENNLDDVKRLADENSCTAIMLEIVQGEGGVKNLDRDFIEGVAKFAAQRDLLLIIDEVQTGNGRSGKLYSYMHYDIQPDIVTTAKGIAGGLPMGVTMLGEKVENVYDPGSHGSTFGGNPVCCAGAISIINRIDDALLTSVTEKADYIRQQLVGAPGIKSVSGLGLMVGIETVRPTSEVVAECREKGVLVLTAKNKVRLLPALNIPKDQLEQAIAVIKEVCGA